LTKQQNHEALATLTQKHPVHSSYQKCFVASISGFTIEMCFLAPLPSVQSHPTCLFQNWKALIALVPLLTGVVWLLGIMSLVGIR
jgi:hypothetical protein